MTETQPVIIRQRPLRCMHCGGEAFARRSAQLNTAFLEFLNLAWLNATADIYVCTQCGFLHWFLNPSLQRPSAGAEKPDEQSLFAEAPEALAEESPPPDDLTEPTLCLACRRTIPAGAAQCASCGWSYK